MPAIHLFSRRTLLGGDDLQLPAVITMMLRIFQLSLLLIPICIHIARDVHVADHSLSKYLWYDPPYHSKPPLDSCRHSHMFPLLLFIYVILSGAVCMVSFGLEVRLYHWSSQGSPTETQPRSRHVESLLELKLVPIGIAKGLVWLVGFASVFTAQRYHQCRAMSFDNNNNMYNNTSSSSSYSASSSSVMNYSHINSASTSIGDDHINPFIWNSTYIWFWVAFGLLMFLQMVESFMSMAFVVGVFAGRPTPPGLRHVTSTSSSMNMMDTAEAITSSPAALHNHELVEAMWAERCDSFCQGLSASTCFFFGGRELRAGGHYEEVARALADYFETRGVLDVVPSDVVTGLLVLQRVQRQRILDARQVIRNESQKTNGTSSSSGTMLLSSSSGGLSHTNKSQKKLLSNNNSNSNSRSKLTSLHSMSNTSDIMLNLSKSSEAALQEEDCGPWTDLLAPANRCISNDQLPTHSSAPNMQREEVMIGEWTGTLSVGDSSSNRSTKSVYRRFQPSDADESAYYIWESRKVLSRTKPLDLRTLQEGARFARYALAIYTWVLYLYVHPVSGMPKLFCAHGRCCCCSIQARRAQARSAARGDEQPLDEELGTDGGVNGPVRGGMDDPTTSTTTPCWMGGRIEGDNLCQTHKAGLLLQAGLDESDLIYAQLRSSFNDNPYCIVVDHAWKSVVLSIRGTFSLEDCVTDVSINPESLESLGEEFGFDAANQYCHGGVLLCVRNVYRDLQRHGYLEKLLLGNGALYRNYTLRLVGHSLGGAIATVLSYMLRQRYPGLQCINYSPPGCSLSWDLAIRCRDWCRTFVLDCDLVPRLSLDTMDQLRNDVLELIGRIKIPKFAVARKFVRGTGLLTCRGCFDDDQDKDRDYLHKSIQDMLYDRNQVPDSDYQRQLLQFKTIQEERRSSRFVRSIKLFPPGRVVHLMKTGERRSCCHSVMKCVTCCMSNAGFEYTPVWIKNDDLNEIVVSPTMGTDHFPNRICSELETLAREYDLNIEVMERSTSFPILPPEP